MKKLIIILFLFPRFIFAQIAVTSPVAGLASTSNGSSYAMTAFPPTANSLLVVFVFGSQTILTTTTITGGSLTWTREATSVVGPNEVVIFWAKVGASPVSTTITWDCTGDAATGAFLHVFQFTGYDAIVANPIRQTKMTSATTSTNANISFTSAFNTNNGYALAWFGQLAASSSTPPTGWTEGDDIAFINPSLNGATAYRAGGETTVGAFTFTNASTTWQAIGVEVYVAGAGHKRGQGHYNF